MALWMAEFHTPPHLGFWDQTRLDRPETAGISTLFVDFRKGLQIDQKSIQRKLKMDAI
jgi:hypothetical protein